MKAAPKGKIRGFPVPPLPAQGEGECSAGSLLFKAHDNGQLLSQSASGLGALARKSADNEAIRIVRQYDKRPI